MKAVKKIFIVLISLFVLVVIVGFCLPKETKLERSRVIKAPVEMIYDQVDNLRNWMAWSPWHQMDPEMKIIYEKSGIGKDASYSWTSEEKNVGNGKLIITDAKHFEFVYTKMEFDGQGEASAKYIFEATDAGINVRWTFYTDGGNNPFTRIMNAMFKGMISKSYDQGLENLEMVCQDLQKSDWFYVEIKSNPAFKYYSLTREVAQEEMDKATEEMFHQLFATFKKNDIEIVGSPFALYHSWGPVIKLECGLIVDDNTFPLKGISANEMKEKTYAVLNYVGPYDQLEKPHNFISNWLKQNKIKLNGPVMESYKTDPEEELNPNKWITYILYPIE